MTVRPDFEPPIDPVREPGDSTARVDELFRAYVGGDPQAFPELYRELSPRVWGFVRKRVRDVGLAEEIYQEVWLKIHRTREHFNPRYPALPWIFTVTRTVLIDVLRKKGRTPEVPTESAALEASAESPVAQEPFTRPSWDELAQGLGTEDRTLLERRYLEEWSFEALAREMKGSEAGIRQRISRLLRRIRGKASGSLE